MKFWKSQCSPLGPPLGRPQCSPLGPPLGPPLGLPPTSSKPEANDLDTFATIVKEIIINRPAMSTQSKMFDDIPGTYMIVKGRCESKTAFFFFAF